MFCTWKWGWGFKNYQAEANIGSGLKVANWMRWYVTIVIPIMIIVLFCQGMAKFL